MAIGKLGPSKNIIQQCTVCLRSNKYECGAKNYPTNYTQYAGACLFFDGLCCKAEGN